MDDKKEFYLYTTHEYRGLTAEIGFSTEDNVFFGKILGISDLVSFESDTVEGMVISFKDAVENYLADKKHI